MKLGPIVALAACGPHVGELAVRAPDHPVVSPCTPSAPLPPLDPAFAPTASGGVALVSATGDARLSADGGALAWWSADSSIVLLVNERDAAAWRVADGTLIDRIACPGIASGDDEIAMSADQRWLVVVVRDRKGNGGRTCALDRTTHAIQTFEDPAAALRFLGGSPTTSVAAAPAPRPVREPRQPRDALGANAFAVSHDGALIAGWYEFPVYLLGGGSHAGSAAPRPSAFLALWDGETGALRWKIPRTDDLRWWFSPGDHYLEQRDSYHADLVRVADGTVIRFGGGVLPIAPDDDHAISYESGPTLWSLSTMQRVLGAPRAREIVARSRDGAVTAVIEHGKLAIERAGACFALGVEPSPFGGGDPVLFSDDGRTLYLGHDGIATISTSTAYAWDTTTGALVHATTVDGPVRIQPLPGRDAFAFPAGDGLRLVDARTGAPRGTALAPRWSQGPFDEHGTSRPVRDRRGEHPDAFLERTVVARDGRRVVGAGYLGISIWDLANPDAVIDLPRLQPEGFIDPIAWSDDERLIAAGTRDGRVALWTRDGRAIAVAAHHDDWVEHLAFSRDGRVLASSGKDGAVELTDTATGARIGAVALKDDRAELLWWSDTQLVIDTARRFRVVVSVSARAAPASGRAASPARSSRPAGSSSAARTTRPART